MNGSGPPRICWVGFHEEGLPALRAVAEAGYDIAAVITLTADAAARRSAATDYGAVCAELGLPLHRVENINDDEAVTLIEELSPDLMIVLGWSQILKERVLSIPPLGVVGAHASLLPSNRGRAPVNWAIIRGEERSGNTLMWLAAGVDSGDIIDQKSFEIELVDTCATVYDKVAASNRTMVLDLLAALAAGDRPGRPQPASSDPLLPGRKPADGLIDWSRPARDIYDLIRGVTRPYPGAFSHLDGEKVHIWRSSLLPIAAPLAAPGTVLGPVISPDSAAAGQAIACGVGAIVVLEAQPTDEPPVSGHALMSLQWQGKMMSNG